MRLYISFFAGVSIVSLLGLILVIKFFSPTDFPVLAPLLFFVLLFLVGSSVFTLVGFGLRRTFMRSLNRFVSFHVSLRQGLLLSLFTCFSAYLIHLQVFTWWALLLALILLVIIETMFTVKETL